MLRYSIHRSWRLGAAIAIAGIAAALGASPAAAWQDTGSIATPYGKLTSNVYYDGGRTVGGARKWNYSVSGSVSGTQSVQEVRITWKGGASMRNSADFSVSAGVDSVSAGGGSSWTFVSQTKHWSNTNGVRTADYTSNMVALPEADYRFGTVSLSNTAYVKFRGDARNWQFTAAA